MKKPRLAMIGIGCVCLVSGAVVGGSLSRVRRVPEADGWSAADLDGVRLGQVSDELDELFEKDFDNPAGNQTGFPARYTLANRCFVLRARYLILFRYYLDHLPALQTGPALAEHRAFLKTENERAEAAGRVFEGGSFQPIVEGRASMEAYAKRIRVMKSKLKALGVPGGEVL